MRCTRWGKLNNNRKLTLATRKRFKRGSKKTGCPNSFYYGACDPSAPNGAWEVRHRAEEGSYLHNHPPVPVSSALAGHRRRARQDDSTLKILTDHAAAGVRPGASIAILREADRDCPIVTKDIQNLRQQAHTAQLGYDGKVEYLFKQLDSLGYWWKFRADSEHNLDALLLVNRDCFNFFKRYPDVLLVDCTYKTNAYNIPLLSIIGHSGNNKAIHFGYALIQGQDESSFRWIFDNLRALLEEEHILNELGLILVDREQACINAIGVSFEEDKHQPQPDEDVEDLDGLVLDNVKESFQGVNIMLCRWHMNKDVLSYARTRCTELGRVKDDDGEVVDSQNTTTFMELYYRTLDSPTEAQFEACCSEIRQMSPKMADYLERNWWPYREMIVACWTNKIVHFGLISTSIVEGAHAKLKRWLPSSRTDILSLFDVIHRVLKGHIKDLLHNEASTSRISCPFFARQYELYYDIRGLVHNYVLDELWKRHQFVMRELEKCKGDLNYRPTPCTGSHEIHQGFPCWHYIMRVLEAGDGVEVAKSIPPELIHRHWWIDRSMKTPDQSYRRLRPFITKVLNKRRKVKARHEANAGASGTRRDPSTFELRETNQQSALLPSSPERRRKEPSQQGQVEYIRTAPASTALPAVNTNQVCPSHPVPNLVAPEQPDTMRPPPYMHPGYMIPPAWANSAGMQIGFQPIYPEHPQVQHLPQGVLPQPVPQYYPAPTQTPYGVPIPPNLSSASLDVNYRAPKPGRYWGYAANSHLE